MSPRILIIVLAFSEDEALKDTVGGLLVGFGSLKPTIVISTSQHATSECQSTAIQLGLIHENVSVYFQKEPFVAAAVMEVVRNIPADYVIYMSADGETPAEFAPLLIREIIATDADIVSASRRLPGGSLTDYGLIKSIVSSMAQVVCRIVYNSKLTEFTYGYRVYKYSCLLGINLKEKKHPFFLESLLIPIRLGFNIAEIPVAWVSRKEGESVMNIKTLLSYLRPIVEVRWRRRRLLMSKSQLG